MATASSTHMTVSYINYEMVVKVFGDGDGDGVGYDSPRPLALRIVF